MSFFQLFKKDLRLSTIFVFYTLISFVFICRLFFIQILDHTKLSEMAQGQYWAEQQLGSNRGDIRSSDGFPLATSQLSFLLYAEPKNIQNKDEYARKLSDLMVELYDPAKETPKENSEPYTESEVRSARLVYKDDLYNKYKKLLENDLYWIGLEKNLPPDKKKKIEELKLGYLGFEEEPMRYYPESTLASHILGFVASDEKGNKKGYYGIEGFFDGDLRGKPGKVIEEKDAFGEPILIGGYRKVSALDGRDIILTIDRSVQYIAEKRLQAAVEKYNAQSGSVIIMDPFTGNVIAMANFPEYNPGDFNSEEKELDEESKRKSIERRNLAISENYEPGSVIKALTISTALDIGKITPESTFEDNGKVLYSTYYIDNWNFQHYGTQTMIQLLQKSNNIGAAYVGHQVGSETLIDYFRKFGLGTKSSIELEGEDAGLLKDSKNMPDIDLANHSFGQGMLATPLQVLNAFNVLANGGKLLKPRIVDKLVDGDREIQLPIKEIRRVISEETSKTITDILLQTVDGGEGRFFNLKTYKISGKTGTAQIFIDGKYDARKTNATFVGYLYNTKKFSMIVRLNTPNSSIFASETAVPLFMSITDDLVKYYGIAPDRTLEEVEAMSAKTAVTVEKPVID